MQLAEAVHMALSKEMFELPVTYQKFDGMIVSQAIGPESLEAVKQFQPDSLDVLTTCYSKSGKFRLPHISYLQCSLFISLSALCRAVIFREFVIISVTIEFFTIGVSVRLSDRSLHREKQKKIVKNCPQ